MEFRTGAGRLPAGGGELTVHVVALDLGRTATGVADSKDPTTPSVIVAAKGLVMWARLWDIHKRVDHITTGADLVVVEGYAFAAADRAHMAGELGGIVRLNLWARGRPFVEMPPSSLKKFATGKGNAKKEQMLQAAWQRLGYKGSDHNEADALFLLQAALVHYRLPGAIELPKTHLEALVKIKWPTLEELGRKVA